jgi:2-octaprenyl-6-methoxyphenol hydroxylase
MSSDLSGVETEVAVVGGGLVGASVALALAQAGRQVTLVEAAPSPPALSGELPWDERCIGLNAASIEILESLSVWPAIRPHAAPIVATHVSESGRFGVARFTAAEAGLDALGYNTPLRVVHLALLDAMAANPAIRVMTPAMVGAVIQDDKGVRLKVQADAGMVELRAALVVACDGAQSPLRTQLGLIAEQRDYAQTALVSAVRVSRPHLGVAYERFTPDGPIALLPRAEGICTLVWTQPGDEAERRAELDDETFIHELQSAFGQRLGRLSSPGRRMRYPLRRVYAPETVSGRVVLAGNAAQTLHPVVAQGFNLGLRDGLALAVAAGSAGDPGRAEVLARYRALRADDRRQVAGFTDALVRLFSNRLPVIAGLRHLGLFGLDVLPVAHRSIMLQNLGLPALARIRAAREVA